MPIELAISPATHSRYLRTHLDKILRYLGVTSALWSITLIPDRQMRALHKKTMGIATTTDVLTFDLRDAPPRRSTEGSAVELDTVLCHDEARRRAKELAHPIKRELLLYALHSLLHVQGYNDTTPTQSRRMHAREDAILMAMGIGPVYEKKEARSK